MAMSGTFLACMGDTPAMQAATGGISSGFAKLANAGLSNIAFGISAGHDLEHHFNIWDGERIRDVAIHGNYFDSIDLNLDELRK
mmetsp:Transcript_18202/g.15866  ORF Transcript_18202/g.15866 Transcript_18202/m.15866 type:complete len:84 (+) Transcript_18202:211-462(+)